MAVARCYNAGRRSLRNTAYRNKAASNGVRMVCTRKMAIALTIWSGRPATMAFRACASGTQARAAFSQDCVSVVVA